MAIQSTRRVKGTGAADPRGGADDGDDGDDADDGDDGEFDEGATTMQQVAAGGGGHWASVAGPRSAGVVPTTSSGAPWPAMSIKC